MPDSLLKTAVPSENDDDDDGWNGRVLDVEKRTKALLKPVQEDVKQMQTKMNELHAKVDRMQEMQAESEARMQQMQAENEARMQQMQAESEARMQQMQAENRQMQAENEARAKITEEKLDLIVSLMEPRA